MAFSRVDIPISKYTLGIVAAGLSLAQYTDIVTTIAGINRHGLLVEGNAFVIKTIQNYGYIGFIGEKIASLIIVFALSAILLKLGYKKSVFALLTGLTIFLGSMAARNIYLLMIWQ